MAGSEHNEHESRSPAAHGGMRATCTLAFHGASANSCPHSLLWVRAPPPASSAADGGDGDDGGPPAASFPRAPLVDTVVYASSGVINLATTARTFCARAVVASVDATLVTRTLDHTGASDGGGAKKLARGEAVEDAAAARSVTALAWVDADPARDAEHADGDVHDVARLFGIVAAFSDGTVTSWRHSRGSGRWTEHVVVGHDPADACRPHVDGADRHALRESVADVAAVVADAGRPSRLLVATASSRGLFLHRSEATPAEEGAETAAEAVRSRRIGRHPAASVRLQRRAAGGGAATDDAWCYLFAGSASPRHNKVWIYTVLRAASSRDDAGDPSGVLPAWTIAEEPDFRGHLLGHQDWVTCLAWLEDVRAPDAAVGGRREHLLASSGHDAKIRLWKFASYPARGEDGGAPAPDGGGEEESGGSDADEADVDDLEEEEEGEARLVLAHADRAGGGNGRTTAVSLEALLLGHEEMITSLAWRPRCATRNAHEHRGGRDRPCLLSSSMDRTILLWREEGPGAGGVWSPISRVGSAGGVLGGPIGASLMGFVEAAFSPCGNRIVGQGYGGSIHFWTQEESVVPQQLEREAAKVTDGAADDEDAEEEDDTLATARWEADPCITGHFRSVEDMSWDPDGEYLLTVSADQTTRLWAEVQLLPEDSSSSKPRSCRWIEIGRPQVHGYDLTSIVCVGDSLGNNATEKDGTPCHRFVSGADEKFLRVFDAPASTLRLLDAIKQSRVSANGKKVASPELESSAVSWRAERGFLPSLGLSNKATADTAECQESSKFAGPTDEESLARTLDTVAASNGSKPLELKLPSERDLGVTSLWPETQKLFGHESELVCLDAYRAQPSLNAAAGNGATTLVASSCKARNDVASAAIRLWDLKKGTCVGILKGGHRSTASTMSFSRDGKYLASSGKDRRICIWERRNSGASNIEGMGGYELSAAVDSAHKRIIWSVHFCPRAPHILASGSRDGLIKIWRVFEGDNGSLEMKETLRFEPMSKTKKNPVTAVAFAEDLIKASDQDGSNTPDYGILGIGTENGRVEVWAVPITLTNMMLSSNNEYEYTKPLLLCAISSDNCHFDTVKKVSWRPNASGHTSDDRPNDNKGVLNLTLATCGKDNGVRIFNVIIKDTA